jgi:hypothetical protein
MASPSADHNLLFGLLALQNGLINQGQLVAAFQAWTLDKSRPLADQLVDRGDLDPDDRAAVEALVARHLKKHGGSPEKSLAALAAGPSTRQGLRSIHDPDLAASLAVLAPAAAEGDRTQDRGPLPRHAGRDRPRRRPDRRPRRRGPARRRRRPL